MAPSLSTAPASFLCTFCWVPQHPPAQPHAIGRSARLACTRCWTHILNISICWVCGEQVVRGDEVVSLGWCFWHRACFGCLLCGYSLEVPRSACCRDGPATEDGGEVMGGWKHDEAGGRQSQSRQSAVELTHVPLCGNCEAEVEGESGQSVLEKGLDNVTRRDGGLSRDRLNRQVEQAEQTDVARRGGDARAGRVSESVGTPTKRYELEVPVKKRLTSYEREQQKELESSLVANSKSIRHADSPYSSPVDGSDDDRPPPTPNSTPLRSPEMQIYLSVTDPLNEPAFRPSPTKPIPSWMSALPSARERQHLHSSQPAHDRSAPEQPPMSYLDPMPIPDDEDATMPYPTAAEWAKSHPSSNLYNNSLGFPAGLPPSKKVKRNDSKLKLSNRAAFLQNRPQDHTVKDKIEMLNAKKEEKEKTETVVGRSVGKVTGKPSTMGKVRSPMALIDSSARDCPDAQKVPLKAYFSNKAEAEEAERFRKRHRLHEGHEERECGGEGSDEGAHGSMDKGEVGDKLKGKGKERDDELVKIKQSESQVGLPRTPASTAQTARTPQMALAPQKSEEAGKVSPRREGSSASANMAMALARRHGSSDEISAGLLVAGFLVSEQGQTPKRPQMEPMQSSEYLDRYQVRTLDKNKYGMFMGYQRTFGREKEREGVKNGNAVDEESLEGREGRKTYFMGERREGGGERSGGEKGKGGERGGDEKGKVEDKKIGNEKEELEFDDELKRALEGRRARERSSTKMF